MAKKSFKIEKNYFTLTGKITAIGELNHIKREKLPDLFKKIITIVTKDNQVLYPEIRNKNLSMLNNISVNDIVTIEYTFEGSEKSGKLYNNVYINSIKKV